MAATKPAGEQHQVIPLSEVIAAVLVEAGTRPIHVGDLIDRTAERGFGLLMLLLGLPMLIPVLPPGSSTLVGPLYIVFAVQLLSGAKRPWMPQRLRDRVLSGHTVEVLRRRGLPIIRSAERLSRPRGIWFAERLVVRMAGVVVLLMGLVLLSPLPFLNTLPAISVMLLGMGLINRDVLFMLAGFAAGGISIGLIGLSAGLIIAVIDRIRSLLP